MPTVFANRIIRKGQDPVDPFTIDDVPNEWKAATLANLLSRGYDGYGNKL